MISSRISTDFATWYRALSLRTQLAAGFIGVIALALAVGLASLVAQDRSTRAVNNLLDVVWPMEEMSLSANVAMLKARRAEKDFLIFQNEFGFREARSRYVTPLRTSLAEVREGMAKMRELSREPEVTQLTQSIETAVARYEAGFLKTVELYGVRGHLNTGFAGRFIESAQAIEAIVARGADPRLVIDLLTLRRREKSALENGIDRNVEAVAKSIDRLKADIALSRLAPGARIRLLELVAAYEHSFRQYVQADESIEAEQGEYLAAAHTVEPLLERLHAHANRNAGTTRAVAETVERIAFWTICIAVMLASLVGLAIATVISRGIAGSVGEGLRFASRIAGGDLSTRLSPRGTNEFATLAMALNRMTQVLQERDAELNRSNALLQQEAREHQVAAERAEYLAYYDILTALPNRGMFSKLLNQTLSLARRDATRFAVLFIDLDGFKKINDTLGHEAGDLLLQEVGKRLQGCLRESDAVARLGGDEFVVLLPALREITNAAAVARKILAAVGESYVVLGQDFRVTASVGVSVYPDDGGDEQSLMKNADIAMYQAKENGKCNFQFYSEEMNRNSFERLALESSLRRGLEQGQFQLHYQPEVDARGGRIVGVEALLRWQHPDLGMVAPAKFLPIAEETGLIVSIGRWVLKTACAQNVAWQRSGLPALRLGINLSKRQLSDEAVLGDVASILRDTGMRADLLQLEITERTLHGADGAQATLKAFKSMGVRIAIDNFGTGYSSLANLGQFPVDTIKIDGSFFSDLPHHAENRRVADAVIAMGRSLSMTVIAECVETRAQVDFLRERSCDQFQGFYFGKAVNAGRFAELLEAQVATGALAA